VSLSDAIQLVLQAPQRFAGLKEEARKRAARYTWKVTARRTIEELERAIEQRSAGGRAA